MVYFFCKNADVDKNSPLAIAKALTHQLMQSPQMSSSSFIDDVRSLMRFGGQTKAINFQPLWKLVCQCLGNLPHTTVILDAADECTDIHLILPGLFSLTQKSSVKVVITSRREPELANNLRDQLSLDMGPEDVRKDIKAYLEYQVSQSKRLSDPHVRPRIVRILNLRSKGMFLWVALMIKELEIQSSIDEIEDTLCSLPDGLDELYERILTRLHGSLRPSRKTLCCRLLRWITLAKRPLHLTEVSEALKIEYAAATGDSGYTQNFLCSAQELKMVCGTLVTVKDGIIQLIHLSTKEFLLDPTRTSNSKQDLQTFFVQTKEDSALLSGLCVTYLSFHCVPEKFTEIAHFDATLLDYARLNWISHLLESCSKALINQATAFQSFLSSRKSFYWLEMCFNIERGTLNLLNRYLQSLTDWCLHNMSNEVDSQPGKRLLQLLQYWAWSYSRLLNDYGPSLELRPYEVHRIDPGRVFEPLDFHFAEAVRHDGSYDPHYVMRGAQFRSTSANFSSHRALQRHTSRDAQYGYFAIDERRNVFFMLDRDPGKVPQIYCQEVATGKRLVPVTDSEFGEDGNDLTCEGATLSADGGYLGVVYSWHEAIETTKGSAIVTTLYTVIWLLSDILDFSGAGSPLWARKIISLSSTVPRIQSAQPSTLLCFTSPIAFGNDGFVYCPQGRINLNTGITEPMSILRHSSSNQVIKFSGNGLSVMTAYDKKKDAWFIADVSPRGDLTTIYSYFSWRSFGIMSLSYSGRFLVLSRRGAHVWSYNCCIYDKISRKFEDLEFLGKELFGVRFLFSRDEESLIGVGETISKPKITSILVWRQHDSKFCLWADKTVKGCLTNFCYGELHRYLYIVSDERSWSRLDLTNKELPNLDELEESPNTRVEYQVHQSGAQMVILKQNSREYVPETPSAVLC